MSRLSRPPRHAARRRRKGRQQGAALLIAMLLLTLVASLASAMVWQQWRAIQVEAAERSRSQSAWILQGALDWARLILREDARSGRPTSLSEPWATPLAEARLSTFLAADRDNNADSGPEAFLAGAIQDAQARYNLRNLVRDGKVVEAQVAVLARLCDALGLPPALAEQIARTLAASAQPGADTPLAPQRLDQLRWSGLAPTALDALREHADLLPVPTAINLNTASAPVLMAVLEGLDAGSAERLIQARQRQAFKVADEARAHIPKQIALDPDRVTTISQFFEIQGQLRLDDRVLRERSLVERRGLDVHVLRRERVGLLRPPGT
ncbi:MAG: type II secretion system minor pseudopilin GspK [Aquabacterium sp.]